jgi:error-prone DNA polymerase
MSRKRSEAALRAHHERFVAGAAERGVAPAVAERVWLQIQGFSGFGFPKAHSAAFGLLAYQSAWLRVHYAPEFLCALLNEQPMGFYPPDSLIHEAQRRGVRVAPVAVNRSDPLCRVERERGGPLVRIGLGYVKGVREEEMRGLAAERERGGPYLGVADLASRSGVGRDGLERLAWAGALDDLARGAAESSERRREDYWRVGVAGGSRRVPSGAQLPLPLDPPRAPELAPLSRWQRVIEDYRATGVNLGEHPLALLRGDLDRAVLRSADLGRVDDGAGVQVAGMVIARQRPETAKGITFMLLEDECGTINLIVPSAVYERRRTLVRAAPLLHARGRLERRDGAINILVADLDPLEPTDPPEPGNQPTKPRTPPARIHASLRRRTRALAVAELRAVAPAGHSFGRRGH